MDQMHESRITSRDLKAMCVDLYERIPSYPIAGKGVVTSIDVQMNGYTSQVAEVFEPTTS